MNNNMQDPKKTQAEEELEDSSRSPGVTDRELSKREDLPEKKDIKQSSEPTQPKSSDKD